MFLNDPISSLIIQLPLTLGVASDLWLTRWLTTLWLAGIGILLGVAVLAILLGFFAILSRIPQLDKWRRNGTVFWAMLAVTVAANVILAFAIRPKFFDKELLNRDEWMLTSIAMFPLILVTVGALLYCGQRRFFGEIWESLTQGVGGWITLVVAIVGVGGLLTTFLVDEPSEVLRSVPNLFSAGETMSSFVVPGQSSTEGEGLQEVYHPVPLKYDHRYVDHVVVRSRQNILISDSAVVGFDSKKPVRVQAREDLVWNRSSSAPPPIPLVLGGNVFIQNLEIDPAEVSFTVRSVAPYPEATSIFIFAAIVVMVGLVWMFVLAAGPKLAAIASSAAKNELAQPLPLILLAGGFLLLIAFVHIPYHTEGEDIKLLKDCGLTLILVVCLFQGVWSASSSVSEEIEGRTALTLMSKPIHRRSFILGKMLGIFWVLLFMTLFLGTVLYLSVAYKPIVDAREGQLDTPLWQACHLEAMQMLPGLAMVLLQATVLSSVAVALATRVPQMANFAICFTIYLIGHLTPSMVEGTVGAFPIIQFVAQLIAAIVPTLDWYSMDKAIDTGNGIPVVYLSAIFVYSILYTAVAVFLGLLLFEDRDLA